MPTRAATMRTRLIECSYDDDGRASFAHPTLALFGDEDVDARQQHGHKCRISGRSPPRVGTNEEQWRVEAVAVKQRCFQYCCSGAYFCQSDNGVCQKCKTMSLLGSRCRSQTGETSRCNPFGSVYSKPGNRLTRAARSLLRNCADASIICAAHRRSSLIRQALCLNRRTVETEFSLNDFRNNSRLGS